MVFAFTTFFPNNSPVKASTETVEIPGVEVLRNDNLKTELLINEDGNTYLVSMDKETKKTYFIYGSKKYEVILTDYNEKDGFVGYVEDTKTGEIVSLNDFKIAKPNDGRIQPMIAIPLLVPPLVKAVEALLLIATLITINNIDYVTVPNISEMRNKHKNKSYFAAFIYYEKHTANAKSHVVIGPGISKGEAENRLMNNANVFSITENLAKGLFVKVTRGPEQHGPYPSYLPHYHGTVPNENKPGSNIDSTGHSYYLGNIWK